MASSWFFSVRICRSVFGYFSTFRGDHITFIFKVKQLHKSPMSRIIWRFWTSLGMLGSATRPFDTLATIHPLTKDSPLRRLVSSNWSQSKVMFLFTTVGCFNPCHMAVTQPAVPGKMWPITLPCYSHHGNFKSDLKSCPGNSAPSRWDLPVSISYRFILCSHSLTWWITSVMKRGSKMKLFHLVAKRMTVIIIVCIPQRHWTPLLWAYEDINPLKTKRRPL